MMSRIEEIIRLLQTATRLEATELIEKLEQLRMLFCGMNIKVVEGLISSPPGVDTPEDAKRVDYQLRKEA